MQYGHLRTLNTDLELRPGYFWELKDSGRVSLDIRGGHATRHVRCLWQDKFFIAPRKFDSFSWDFPDLRCVRVEFEPVAGTELFETREAKYCDITAEYEVLPALNTPRARWSTRTKALGQTKGRVWTSDEKDCDVSQSIYVTLTELALEVWRTVIDPYGYDAITGCVNNGLWRGALAGTVLFDAYDIDEDFDTLGEPLYKCCYKFLYNTSGHEYIWRSDIADWDTLTPVLYPAADFTVLGLE